jgi:hypothetical protein
VYHKLTPVKTPSNAKKSFATVYVLLFPVGNFLIQCDGFFASFQYWLPMVPDGHGLKLSSWAGTSGPAYIRLRLGVKGIKERKKSRPCVK